jgi:hypothetical protein
MPAVIIILCPCCTAAVPGSVPRALRASRLRRVWPSPPACHPTASWVTSAQQQTTPQHSRMETLSRCKQRHCTQHCNQQSSTAASSNSDHCRQDSCTGSSLHLARPLPTWTDSSKHLASITANQAAPLTCRLLHRCCDVAAALML